MIMKEMLSDKIACEISTWSSGYYEIQIQTASFEVLERAYHALKKEFEIDKINATREKKGSEVSEKKKRGRPHKAMVEEPQTPDPKNITRPFDGSTDNEVKRGFGGDDE